MGWYNTTRFQRTTTTALVCLTTGATGNASVPAMSKRTDDFAKELDLVTPRLIERAQGRCELRIPGACEADASGFAWKMERPTAAPAAKAGTNDIWNLNWTSRAAVIATSNLTGPTSYDTGGWSRPASQAPQRCPVCSLTAQSLFWTPHPPTLLRCPEKPNEQRLLCRVPPLRPAMPHEATGVCTSVLLARADGAETGTAAGLQSVDPQPRERRKLRRPPVNAFPTLEIGTQAWIQCYRDGYYTAVLNAVGYKAQCYALGESPWASGHYNASGGPPGTDLIKTIGYNNLTVYDGAPPTPPPAAGPTPQPHDRRNHQGD